MNGFLTDRDLRRPVRGLASVIARVQSERRIARRPTRAGAARLACTWVCDPRTGRPVARWSDRASAGEAQPPGRPTIRHLRTGLDEVRQAAA